MRYHPFTLEQMRRKLKVVKFGRNQEIIFRPGDPGLGDKVEMPPELLLGAFDEIVNKVPLVEAGLDEFTNAEKVMFILFKNHAEWC